MLKSWMEKGAKWGAAGPAGPAGLVLAPNKHNCQLQRVPASLSSSRRLQPRSSGGQGEEEVEDGEGGEGGGGRRRSRKKRTEGKGTIEGGEGGAGVVRGDGEGEGNRGGG